MSIMEAFGFPSAGAAKSKLFEEMRKVKASRIEAGYSGGNDEGGVNDIRVLDAAGEPMFVNPERTEGGYANLDWQHPLLLAADAMLSVDFGSWAGEFEAYGTLYADVKENKVWREGSIQSGYDSDSNEY